MRTDIVVIFHGKDLLHHRQCGVDDRGAKTKAKQQKQIWPIVDALLQTDLYQANARETFTNKKRVSSIPRKNRFPRLRTRWVVLVACCARKGAPGGK